MHVTLCIEDLSTTASDNGCDFLAASQEQTGHEAVADGRVVAGWNSGSDRECQLLRLPVTDEKERVQRCAPISFLTLFFTVICVCVSPCVWVCVCVVRWVREGAVLPGSLLC